jgi:O-antigen/teichoic acid export membrane protein
MTPLLAARFFEPVFQVADRPGLSARLGVVYLCALAPAVTAALLLAPHRPELLVAAHACAGVAYAVAGLRLSHALMPLRLAPDPRRIRLLLRVAAPVGGAALLAALNLRVGVAFLDAERPGQDVAVFLAAQRFLEFGAAVAVTFSTPLFAIFGRLGGLGAAAPTRRLLIAAAAAFAPVALLAPTLSGPLVALVYGPSLGPAAAVLPFMAAQFAAFGLGLAIMPTLLTLARPDAMVWGAAAALAVNTVLCLILVPAHGATGAAIASLAAEFVIAGVPLTYVALRLGGVIDLAAVGPLAAGCAALLAVLHATAGLVPDSLVGALLRSVGALAAYAVVASAAGLLGSRGLAVIPRATVAPHSGAL